MIQNFDYCAQKWVQGKGRQAVWQEINYDEKRFYPQYLMDFNTFLKSGKAKIGGKLGVVKVSSATNTRSMKCAFIPSYPCGESVYTLQTEPNKIWKLLILESIFSSFAFDFLLRARFGGINISAYLLGECPVPELLDTSLPEVKYIINSATKLSFLSPIFSIYTIQLKEELNSIESITPPLSSKTALKLHERLRIQCSIDAIIAHVYGFNTEDVKCILSDCDQPSNHYSYNYKNLDPKGFWRVDKEKDPELRHTVLSLVAFQELKKIGLDAFLNLNDGEGWMLPQTLRLADYGLGHDDRAKEPQPVAPRLGERYLPWQLVKTAEQSWAECERHAENLRQLLGETPTSTVQNVSSQLPSDPNYQPPTDLFGNPLAVNLFGEIVDDNPKKRR